MAHRLFTDAEILSLRTNFKQADADGSGSISTDEAKQCLKKFGINLKDAQVDQLVKKVDSNNSGTIEFVEFMKFANFAKLQENLEQPQVKERGFPPQAPPSVSSGSGGPMEARRAVFRLIKGFVKEQQDVLGWADPFVVIKIGVAERKSKVIKNQKNPVWNEQLIFGDVSLKEATNVKIQLWDWDKLSNDIIGTGTLSLAQYDKNKQTVRVPILNDSGSDKGWVELEVELVSGGEYMASVKVVDGEVYERHDTFGWADPYVVLKVGANEQKTVEKKNARSPVWNEEFSFNGVSKAEAGNITLTMWDWEKMGEHEFVGSLKLDLLPFLNNKQKIKVVFLDPKKKKAEQGHANIEVLLETEPAVVKEREFIVSQAADDAVRLVSEDEANKQRGAEQAALAAKERALAEAQAVAGKAKADAEAAQAAAENAKASSEKAEADAKKAKEDLDREKDEATKAKEAADTAKADAVKEKEDAKNAREVAEKEKEDAKNAKEGAEKAAGDSKKAQEDAEKAKADSEKAQADAKKAQEDAEKAKADGEKAEADAKKAKEDADREKEEARLAREAAEKEKEDAKNAKEAAEKAAADSKKAQEDAEKAKADAEKAQADAKKAQEEAEKAKADAEKAQADAKKAQEDAEKAKANAAKQSIVVTVYGDLPFPTASFVRVPADGQ